jgi:hypothetical protein
MTTKLSIREVPLVPPRAGLGATLAWGTFFVLLIWAWEGADMRPLALFRDSANMATLARDFFLPNFHDWRIYLQEMVITIHIALWGTVLAVICAVPCGLLSAENLVPSWDYQPMRRPMDACRAINEMVFAMLFIVAVGLSGRHGRRRRHRGDSARGDPRFRLRRNVGRACDNHRLGHTHRPLFGPNPAMGNLGPGCGGPTIGATAECTRCSAASASTK